MGTSKRFEGEERKIKKVEESKEDQHGDRAFGELEPKFLLLFPPPLLCKFGVLATMVGVPYLYRP